MLRLGHAGDNRCMKQAHPIRPAEPHDVPAIVGLIHELAAFEKLTHLCEVRADTLAPHLFGHQPGARPTVECVVGEVSGVVVAFALFFPNFSTFLGKPGLYLEDLYIQPAHRGDGLGKALLEHLAGLAVERGCGRFEWCVLDWNERAIRFYEGMGATVMPDWRLCRMTGERLEAFGK
jgi:GNAT superfamily N-acetyltransferase